LVVGTVEFDGFQDTDAVVVAKGMSFYISLPGFVAKTKIMNKETPKDEALAGTRGCLRTIKNPQRQ
jgi:hypothetical protein